MVRRTSKENEEEIEKVVVLNEQRIDAIRRTYIQWAHEHPQENAEHQLQNPILYEGDFEGSMTFEMPDTTGYCAICQENLTADFPKDYPDDWKFCCSCLGWAKSIVVRKKEDWVKKALNISPTIKKIYERITVFGSERKE